MQACEADHLAGGAAEIQFPELLIEDVLVDPELVLSLLELPGAELLFQEQEGLHHSLQFVPDVFSHSLVVHVELLVLDIKNLSPVLSEELPLLLHHPVDLVIRVILGVLPDQLGLLHVLLHAEGLLIFVHGDIS